MTSLLIFTRDITKCLSLNPILVIKSILTGVLSLSLILCSTELCIVLPNIELCHIFNHTNYPGMLVSTMTI